VFDGNHDMNEQVANRRRSTSMIAAAVLLVLGAFAVAANLGSGQSVGLGLAVLGGSAILLFAFTATVPAARHYFYSEAEQRVIARDAPAFFLMLVIVWVMPGLLGYFEVVPDRAAFMLAFAAFWLLGLPVLGWHQGRVVAERQPDQHAAAESAPAAPAKGLAVTLLGYWWSLIPGALAGALMLMAFFEISGALERKQPLEITNVGSRPVSVGEETLQPGVKYLARLPDATPIVVEGKEVATFKHRPRSAAVEKSASGQVEFRFTDE
jgi:hypothetical protein